MKKSEKWFAACLACFALALGTVGALEIDGISLVQALLQLTCIMPIASVCCVIGCQWEAVGQ